MQRVERDRGHGRRRSGGGLKLGRTRASAAATFSAISVDTRTFDSAVTPAMCGVSSRFGQPASGDPAGERLLLEHVERRAAQAIRPERGGDRRFVDDAAARRVDQYRAGLHAREARGVDQMPRRGDQRHVQRDHVGLGEQRVEAARPPCRSAVQTSDAAAICASKPITLMPSARARRPARRPMPPKPTMPSVLPASSRPLDSAGRGHSPARDRRRRRIGAAQQEHRGADHVLGHGQRIGAGGRNHFDPPLAAGVDVDVVEADAEPADDLQHRRGAEQLAIDLRPVAHDERVGARELLPQRRGRSTSALS